MTVYFASSEDIDFDNRTANIVTSAGKFDASYARACFRCILDGSLDASIDTGISTMYMTCRAVFENAAYPSSNRQIFTFRDGGTDVIRLIPVSGVWTLQTYDSGWISRATFSTLPGANVLVKLTLKVVLHASEGEITAWIGDTEVASWTGDTIGSTGATTLDTIKFRSNAYTSGAEVWYSEIIIADELTINMRVATLVFEADGSHSEWTNGWANIDEITENQGDLIQSDVADQRELMNLSAYNGSADLIVRRIIVSARAIRGVGGPQNLQLAVRHGTTDGFSSSKALSEIYTTYRDNWDINPDTGVAWTIADLASLQAGVKSIT